MFKLQKGKAEQVLAGLYPEYFSLTKGKPVQCRPWRRSGLEVLNVREQATIYYQTLSDKFKALGLLAIHPEQPFIRMEAAYTFRGLMADMSRNGVARPEFLKKWMVQLSLMGLNALTLYTEDTYEVSGHPLVGYLRGKYTKAELKDLDRYAGLFGIEMFPCIQTIGHFSQILKFNHYADIRDTEWELNVESAKAARFVRELLRNASEPYQSKLIHVGMDETWSLGRGKCFKTNQKMDPRQMYVGHLARVAKLCAELGLKPMMWGDIVLGQYSTERLTPAQVKLLPKNMTMDFWNYYAEDKKVYKQGVERYRKMGYDPIISPGLTDWNRWWGYYPKAERSTKLFMETAHQMGVKRSLMTMWGDDGQETPFSSNWPGLAMYSELCWKGHFHREEAQRMVRVLSGDPWESFVGPCQLDTLNTHTKEGAPSMAKPFLYDDPLLRIYSSHARGKTYSPMFLKIKKQLAKAAKKAHPRNRLLLQYAFALADLLSVKADLGNEAYAAYQRRDKNRLRAVAGRVPEVAAKCDRLWELRRRIWLDECKPFGLEVIDLRIGGLLQRLKVFRSRIADYLSGRLDSIEEFEQKPQKLWKYEEATLGYSAVSTITVVR